MIVGKRFDSSWATQNINQMKLSLCIYLIYHSGQVTKNLFLKLIFLIFKIGKIKVYVIWVTSLISNYIKSIPPMLVFVIKINHNSLFPLNTSCFQLLPNLVEFSTIERISLNTINKKTLSFLTDWCWEKYCMLLHCEC